jgi:transposase
MRHLSVTEVTMRGQVDKQEPLWVHFSVEAKIPADHPLRRVKAMVDGRLAALSGQFTKAYPAMGRPSIPPEQLLQALLLQAFYSIRSERQLVEQLNWNLLFRWFVDLPADAPVWDATGFTHNRERFAEHGLVRAFFNGVVQEALAKGLASSDHFSVDGTLIQAWASLKSLTPKDGPPSSRDGDPGNPSVEFHGQRRTNATHVSTTDPEAKLARRGKGKEAKLSHGASVLMENRNGLCVGVAVHDPFLHSERAAAPELVREAKRRLGLTVETVGADAGYAHGEAHFVALDRLGVEPHVAGLPPTNARERKDWKVSQKIRKRIEEGFGWMKTIGGQARTKFRGRWRLKESLLVTAAAYNLVRMATCLA